MSPPPDDFEKGLLAQMHMLRRFAISLTRNEDRAADLVQETIVRALTHRDTFEPGTNLGAWLLTVLRNLYRTEYRKRRREVEDVDGIFAKSVPVEDSPLRKMEVQETLRFIEKMPSAFRTPLRLIADGATYEEVAVEILEQVGTVKSRVNRGRTLLKSAQGGGL